MKFENCMLSLICGIKKKKNEKNKTDTENKDYREQRYREQRLTDTENKVMVTSGVRDGGGEKWG